jgi:DnaJ-class molecular chaperone
VAVERTLYEVLQVDPRAEAEIVEAAYRRLARKYHP